MLPSFAVVTSAQQDLTPAAPILDSHSYRGSDMLQNSHLLKILVRPSLSEVRGTSFACRLFRVEVLGLRLWV